MTRRRFWAAVAATLSLALASCAVDGDEVGIEEQALGTDTTVSPALARAIAETYQLADGTATTPRTVRSSSVMVDRSGRNALYAFNFNEGGFVVIAADFEFAPILAFGDEDTIDLERLPPGQDEWGENTRLAIEAVRGRTVNSATDDAERQRAIVEEYEQRGAWGPLLDQIAARTDVDGNELSRARSLISTDNLNCCVDPDPDPVPYCTSHVLDKVPSMLKTRWGQKCGFNKQVKAYGAYCGLAPTGCGATAMAQLVFFHKKAPWWKGFNWDMPLTPTGTVTAVDNRARLLYDAAVSMKSSFGWFSTSSNTSDTRDALSSYGYGATMGDLPFGPGQIAFNALPAGKPFLMRGSSATSGHIWVVDGYSRYLGYPSGCKKLPQYSTKYYSYNWGWEGASAFYKEGDYAGFTGMKKYIHANPPAQ